MRSKFFIAFSLPVLLFGGFILLYFSNNLRTEAIHSIEERLETLSEILAFSVSPALDFQDPETANETLDAARQNEEIDFVLLFNQKDELFAGYGEDFLTLAQSVDLGQNQLLDDREMMVISVPVVNESESIGKLVIGHSLSLMNDKIYQSRNYVLVVGCFFLLLGVGFVFWISTLFTRNLTQMVKVVRKIGTGDFSRKAPIQNQDEVGILARAINHMSVQLENSTDEIKRREYQFRGLADNMNEGLVRLDPSCRIQYVNPKFCELFDTDPEQVFDLPLDAVVKVENEDLNLLEELKGSEEGQFEMCYLGKENLKNWLLVSFTIVQVPEEEDQTIALFTDITKIKKAESELVFKNRELDTFVYKASHDLKAPLASLKGLMDVYKDSDADEQATLFPLIEKTVDKMDNVLLGLLEVTWIKQGALHYEEISLNSMVDAIMLSIKYAKGFESVEIRRNFEPGMTVISDNKMLMSVMQNLIQNAIKYHRDEGKDRFVEIRAKQEGDQNTICIRDNGPGIPESAQPKLFDMFYRATNRSKGSGLGLYIVKTSMDKLSGSVSLTSKEGVGTEFRLQFQNGELSEVVEGPKLGVSHHS